MVQRKPVVIGIAGGSGSGKSTVISRIITACAPQRIAVIDHDAYYKDLSHLPFEERTRFNYDHPNALETGLMREHIDALMAGSAIHKPVYDFKTHTRAAAFTEVASRPVLIIEGILVLAEPLLLDTMDIKIFVDTDDDVRLVRRIRRDLTKRGRPIHTILEQYEQTVRPMHIEFVEPSKRNADVIIPRGGYNQVAIDMVLAQINMLLTDTTR